MPSLTLNHTLARVVQRTESLRERYKSAGKFKRKLTASIDTFARGIWHVWRNRQYLSMFKLTNMAFINIQSKLKTERVIGMPYRMKIEPTNICNTKCQLCPTGIGINARKKGVMDFEKYKKLIDQFKRTLYTLDLSMWGDPLIVPDIYNMVAYAHKRGIWTYLSSNLHAFKPHKGQAEALINSGLDMLTCSLHGASQETYELYQPGKSFDESINKVKAIVEKRRELNSATPVIQLNFVVTKHNEHEIEDFKKLAESLDCKPIFSSPSLNLRFLDRDKDLVPLSISGQELKSKTRNHMEHWLPSNKDYIVAPYLEMEDGQWQGEQYNGNKIMDCQWPWKDAVINYDGSVATCCGSFEQRDDMGNAFDHPFQKVWNNKSYRLARRSFKKPVEQTDDHANPCRDCPGFMV